MRFGRRSVSSSESTETFSDGRPGHAAGSGTGGRAGQGTEGQRLDPGTACVGDGAAVGCLGTGDDVTAGAPPGRGEGKRHAVRAPWGQVRPMRHVGCALHGGKQQGTQGSP